VIGEATISSPSIFALHLHGLRILKRNKNRIPVGKTLDLMENRAELIMHKMAARVKPEQKLHLLSIHFWDK
jgi:hypothetical protein